MKRILYILFTCVAIATQSSAGVLNYYPFPGYGSSPVQVKSIIASDKADYVASDIMQGNIDVNNINFTTDDLKKLGYIAEMSIDNNTSANLYIDFKIKISSSVEGPITEITTRANFTLQPHPRTNIINGDDINNAASTTRKLSGSDAFQQAAKNRYTNSFDGGFIPARTYTIHLTIFQSGHENNVYQELETSFTQIGDTGKTSLNSPPEGNEIRKSNPYPTFSWYVSTRRDINLKYVFSIYEMKEFDNKNSAVQGIAKYSREIFGQNSFTYPSDAPELEVGKKYAWKIDAYDKDVQQRDHKLKQDGNTSWFIFEAIRPPALSEPLGQFDMLPRNFKWDYVEGADRYILTIANNKNFTDSKKIEVKENRYLMDNSDKYFEPGKIYYWKVQALNKNGELWGKESPYFTIMYVRQLTLYSPVGTVVNILPPSFRWSALDGADSYLIKIADNPSFQNFKDYTVANNNFQPENSDFFTLDKTYYWKVQALNNSGNKWGPESPMASFKSPERALIQIISPIGEQLNNTDEPIRFMWQTVDWANRYDLKIADNKDFSNAKIINVSSIPYIYQNDENFIKLDKKYFWQVIPYDENNKNYDKKSDIGYFSAPQHNAPELLNPIAEEIQNINVINFNWIKVKWATNYQLLIADNKDMLNAKSIEAFPPFTYQNDGFIKFAKQYYWQVIPLDDNGKHFDKKSIIQNFKTKQVANIELLSPVGERLDKYDSVTIKWVNLDGAASYQIKLSEEDATLKNASVYQSNENYINISGVNIFKPGFKYYYKVIALDKDQQVLGSGSKIGLFYIANKDEIQPTIIVGPIGKISELFPVLKWIEVPNALKYILKIAQDKGNEVQQEIKGTEIELSKLLPIVPGATYKWSVQASDKEGKPYGTGSKGELFTLPIPQVKIIGPVNKIIEDKNIKLSWKTETFLDEYKVKFGKGETLEDVKEYSVKEGFLELKDVLPGKYSWQVAGFKKGEEVLKYSDIALIDVLPPNAKGKIELMDPVNKNIFADKVIFQWNGVENITEYKVKIGKGTMMNDPIEFKTKDKVLEVNSLKPGSYSWQVQALKDGKEVLNPSNVALFRYDFARKDDVSGNNSTTSNSNVSGDIKEQKDYIEATTIDLAKFAEYVKDFVKTNGGSSVLEGMNYDEFSYDGSKDKINKLLLDDITKGVIEIKYIKVK